MPAEVRALARPWRSLVGSIEHLTEELEREFRFGHRVGLFAGSYRLGGSIKGGSSAVWAPASKEQFAAFQAWSEIEGIRRTNDAESYRRLAELLARNEIALTERMFGDTVVAAGPRDGRGELYRLTVEVLDKLPPSHLAREEMGGLQIGGWGPDSAKASAYTSGCVQLYQFAITGALRTFAGLLLHEMGHAHCAALRAEDYGRLRSAHSVIADAYAFVGVEFLLDGEARKVYQQFLPDEFIAETYLVYASQGEALREFRRSQEDPKVRAAWEEVYSVFRRTFDGVEYD